MCASIEMLIQVHPKVSGLVGSILMLGKVNIGCVFLPFLCATSISTSLLNLNLGFLDQSTAPSALVIMSAKISAKSFVVAVLRVILLMSFWSGELC